MLLYIVTVIEDRLKSLCGDVEVRVLFFISRALFKEHRLMFALHLIRGMHPDLFQKQEWEVFTGAVVASVASHTDGILLMSLHFTANQFICLIVFLVTQ